MMLLELAERCEQAAGPEQELDMLIDCALKGIVPVYPTEGHPTTPGRGGRIEAKGTFALLGWIDPGEVARNFSPYGSNSYPPVTASLDSAMTLVPEGFAWSVGRIGSPETHRCNAWVMSPPYSIGADIRTGVTGPLALCAAALRARAAGASQ